VFSFEEDENEVQVSARKVSTLIWQISSVAFDSVGYAPLQLDA